MALTHLSVGAFAGFQLQIFPTWSLHPQRVISCSAVTLFSRFLATSSEFSRADCSVRTQLETGPRVGGSITCSSQRRERARNIAWRQYVSPTGCFVFVLHGYLYFQHIYSGGTCECGCVFTRTRPWPRSEADGLELDPAAFI